MREAVVSFGDDDLEALGLSDMVEVFEDAGLVSVEEKDCRVDGATLEVEVESEVDGEALSADEAVDDLKLVSERADSFLYLVEFTAPALEGEFGDVGDGIVGTCDPEVGESEVTSSFVGSQEVLRELLGGYDESGVRLELESFGDYDGEEDPLSALTERQREVLETAYRQGYFDTPREASTEEVAEEVGVDSSTVSEHLQRAERNLFGEYLQE